MSTPADIVEAAALVAAGTTLREALESVLAAHLGALVTIGDDERVSALADGGFTIDAPFTAEALYELCKMDGGVILDAGLTRIVRANVHFAPGRGLHTAETGIRHRTAEQLSLATDALVVAVSQSRGTISLYRAGRRDVVAR